MDQLNMERKLQEELRGILTEGEFYMICSQTAVITYCSPDLEKLIEQPLVGLALHQFAKDDDVVRVILDAHAGRESELNLKIARRPFRCRMRPYQEKSFLLVLMPVNQDERDAKLSSAIRLQQEIRDGIQVILAALGQLKARDDEKDLVYQAMIRKQTFKLLRLADNMMDMTRFKEKSAELQLSSLDLCRLLQDFRREAARVLDQIGVQLVLELPNDFCFMRGDKDKILRILLNLVNRSLSGEETRRIRIRLVRSGDSYRIIYRDDRSGDTGLEAAAQNLDDLPEEEQLIPVTGDAELELIQAFAQLHDGGLMVSTQADGRTVYTVALRDMNGKTSAGLRSLGVSYQDATGFYLKELSPSLPTELFIRK